jgi:hypothetical protein
MDSSGKGRMEYLLISFLVLLIPLPFSMRLPKCAWKEFAELHVIQCCTSL